MLCFSYCQGACQIYLWALDPYSIANFVQFYPLDLLKFFTFYGRVLFSNTESLCFCLKSLIYVHHLKFSGDLNISCPSLFILNIALRHSNKQILSGNKIADSSCVTQDHAFHFRYCNRRTWQWLNASLAHIAGWISITKHCRVCTLQHRDHKLKKGKSQFLFE